MEVGGMMGGRVEWKDRAEGAESLAKVKVAIDKFVGKPIVRGGKRELIEGSRRPRNTVLEFPSFEQARGYATSPEYDEAKNLRQGAGTLDMIVIEGV